MFLNLVYLIIYELRFTDSDLFLVKFTRQSSFVHRNSDKNLAYKQHLIRMDIN
jgi:hypothetical protein